MKAMLLAGLTPLAAAALTFGGCAHGSGLELEAFGLSLDYTDMDGLGINVRLFFRF
jgi:hypothetical protein